MEEFKQPQPTEYTLTSIAISLKRIADVICRPPPAMAEITKEQEEEFSKHKYGFIVTKS